MANDKARRRRSNITRLVQAGRAVEEDIAEADVLFEPFGYDPGEQRRLDRAERALAALSRALKPFRKTAR